MTVSEERLKEIIDCAEFAVKKLLKKIELEFAIDFKKSGRSGNNGIKFNNQASILFEYRNNNDYLTSTGCFSNHEEKSIVRDYFTKIAEQKRQRARSINHKTQR